MADRPILFGAPMVRATLREIEKPGTGKTQTRRIIKPVKMSGGFTGAMYPHYINGQLAGSTSDPTFDDLTSENGGNPLYAGVTPYCPGDRLWVREAWRSAAPLDDTPPRDMEDLLVPPVRYEADGEAVNWKEWRGHDAGRLRAAMHMPRWASRLTLNVTNVRVQRLQDISDEDAISEGVVNTGRREGAPYDHFAVPGFAEAGMEHDPVPVFGNLWEHINGDGSWAANPWVVAVTFRPILANIDRVEALAA